MGMTSTTSRRGPKAEMNITPLVDVVLVLLIIFLVATPLTMKSVPLHLPARGHGGPPSTQIVVELGPAGGVTLAMGSSREQLTAGELTGRLRALGHERLTSSHVFVDFHSEVPYGRAVALADTLRSLGIEAIRLAPRTGD